MSKTCTREPRVTYTQSNLQTSQCAISKPHNAKCLRLALLLTSLFRLHLPIFLQLSAALGCRTNTAWVLSQGCHIMPRQRPLVPDGSSWILPLRVPPSSAAFPLFPQLHIPCSYFPPFLVRSITRCDCASEAVTS